jgi:hypothetical protein
VDGVVGMMPHQTHPFKKDEMPAGTR